MQPLIVANWKMNPTSLAEAKKLFRLTKNKAVICPPFIYIAVLKANGSQDCFWEEKGAYTGETSPLMLRDLGVEYVILGHSERRKYQKETNQIIEKKLKACLKAGLRPILCIDKISQIPRKIKEGYILAFEPLSAIGTGKPYRIEKAKMAKDAIKKTLRLRSGQEVPLLYGGSVNSLNARDYIKKAGFDGLLVGGASLNHKELVDIIKRVC